MRHLLIIPTILVLAAVATMVSLGIWQVGRMDEKAALIALYEAAEIETTEVSFPTTGEGEELWFRRSTVTCSELSNVAPVSGTAANGAKGWTIRADCQISGSADPILVDLGFTQTLGDEDWTTATGAVTGIIAPGPRLVADPQVDGLYPLAKPDPGDLPNNHLSYAVQWFFFALTALVIYFFAVRARLSRKD